MRNAARVAAVWLDEYIRYFHETVSGSEYINTGDISQRKGTYRSFSTGSELREPPFWANLTRKLTLDPG